MTLLHIPQNFETALEVEAVVSSVGAVPATIAIIQGRPCIGLSRAELESIAKNGSAVSHQGGCVNQWLWTISPNDLDELITSLKTSGNNLLPMGSSVTELPFGSYFTGPQSVPPGPSLGLRTAA